MVLKQQFLTANNCYKAGTPLVPKGVMWHSTGAPNPNLRRYVQPDDGLLGNNPNGNSWNQPSPDGQDVCVHAFIGLDKNGNVATYQTLPWDMKGWHCYQGINGSGNDTHISFEICEDYLNDESYFNKVYQEGIELTAYLCSQFNLNPLEDGVVICHSEGASRGIASFHADVMHWFPLFGKTMDDVRRDVAALMGSSSGGGATEDNDDEEEVIDYDEPDEEEKTVESLEDSDAYMNYKRRYEEQYSILIDLVKKTFYDETGTYCINPLSTKNPIVTDEIKPSEFLEYGGNNFAKIKENWVDNHAYSHFGMLGQYNTEFKQIQEWKKEQARYLKDINRISLEFYRKYEPFLKEGTWSDSNYLSDNSYYFGAKEVAKRGAIPKLNYNISVLDLNVLPGYEDYEFNLADTTYVEDVSMFGINKKTGMPNKLRVIVSQITSELDKPEDNTISVQNYTTQFEDLFQQVTASVQSLQFNENIYKRSSNFTSTQSISNKSLQGALDTNELTLINTPENNININSNGQSGSDINNHADRYKLDGQGLKFSNDGGQSWNVGVGPSGINADYLKLGSIDTSKIQLIDNDYLYFLWDKSGISAYRDPRTSTKENPLSDYTRFNKFGLSLVENNIIRLRAGYSFSGKDGKMNSEKDIAKNANVGFYLYNDKGNVIFSTESIKNSARLSLAGEMYVCDNLEKMLGDSFIYSDFICSATLEKVYYLNDTNSTEQYLTTEFTADLDKALNGEKIADKKYTYDTDKFFTVSWGDGSKKFVYTEKENKYFYKNSVKVIMNIYEVINNEEEYKFTINTELSKIEGTYCEIRKENFNIKLKSDNVQKTFNSKEPAIIYDNDLLLYVLNEEIIERDTQALNNIYECYSGDTYYYYKTEQKITDDSEIIENAVGIFVNNQHINHVREPDKTRRLWSCVSRDGDGIRNILTVLNNGKLYMGGKIVEYNSKGNPIKNNDISNMSDFCSIGNLKECVVIDENGISIGGKDLIKYIDGQISSVVNNKTLISHNHGIGGAKVVSTEIGEIKGSKNFEETTVAGDRPYKNDCILNTNGDTRILVTGLNDTGGYTTCYVKLSDFIEALALEIKSGTRTSTEGSASGSSSVIGGYYVEDLGG